MLRSKAAESRRRATLFEWRVVTTRPAHQSAALVAALEERGASVIERPAIAITAPQDAGTALREAAGRLGDFEWIVFTSENAVDRFLSEVGDGAVIRPRTRRGDWTRDCRGARHAGDRRRSRSRPLHRRGSRCLVPARPSAAACCYPAPPAARDVVPEGLRRIGWEVEVVEAYRTVPAEPSPRVSAAARAADAITFTSSSTVTGYLSLFDPRRTPSGRCDDRPITTKTARSSGVSVDIEAEVHSVLGLVGTRSAVGPPTVAVRRPVRRVSRRLLR